MNAKRRTLPIESTAFEEIELIEIHMFNVGWAFAGGFYHRPFSFSLLILGRHFASFVLT